MSQILSMSNGQWACTYSQKILVSREVSKDFKVVLLNSFRRLIWTVFVFFEPLFAKSCHFLVF